MRQALELARLAIGAEFALLGFDLALLECRVVAADVTEAALFKQLIAALHLAHRPRQCVCRLLGVGNGLGEEMRDPLVLGHLDALGIDEDHPHIVGGLAHHQRGDDRVDARALTRTGRAGDEGVWHLGEVDEKRCTVDVSPDRNVHSALGLGRFGGSEDVADCNDLAIVVRHLYPDGLLTRDGGDDANVWRRHCIRDVIGEVLDLGDLDAETQFEFESGDGRTDDHVDQAGLDLVLSECPFENSTSCDDRILVDALGT